MNKLISQPVIGNAGLYMSPDITNRFSVQGFCLTNKVKTKRMQMNEPEQSIFANIDCPV